MYYGLPEAFRKAFPFSSDLLCRLGRPLARELSKRIDDTRDELG
jgi:hypothetical protein